MCSVRQGCVMNSLWPKVKLRRIFSSSQSVLMSVKRLGSDMKRLVFVVLCNITSLSDWWNCGCCSLFLNDVNMDSFLLTHQNTDVSVSFHPATNIPSIKRRSGSISMNQLFYVFVSDKYRIITIMFFYILLCVTIKTGLLKSVVSCSSSVFPLCQF